MNSNAVDESQEPPTAVQESRHRSPLAQLVHALNQPLTGLQCADGGCAGPAPHGRTTCAWAAGIACAHGTDARAGGGNPRSGGDGRSRTDDSRKSSRGDWRVANWKMSCGRRRKICGRWRRKRMCALPSTFLARRWLSSRQSMTRPALHPGSLRPGNSLTFAPVIFRLLDSALSLAESGTRAEH